MAPLPELEDVYRVAFNWNYDDIVNVQHFHMPSASAAEVFAMLQGNVNGAMWATNVTFHKIQSLDITPLFADSATQTFLTDGSSKWEGQASGTEVLPNTAAVVSMKTSLRGPANRGRAYIGPMGESVFTSGQLDNTKRTAMSAAWNAFGVACIGDDAQHVVASYTHSTAITILSYSVNQFAGTQRRRQSRHPS
jgi:ethanolamine utilization microcompartment shell protein EutL